MGCFADLSGLDPRLSKVINEELYRDYELIDNPVDADVLLVHISPLTVESNWACKYVLCPCTNTNHITIKNGAKLLSLKDTKEKLGSVVATAHHTIFLIMSAVWGQSFKPTINMTFKRPLNPRRSLVGMKLGIIGLGRIGRIVEGLARNLGMITSWIDKDFETCTKHELLTQSDIITLHTTVENGDKPILGKREFNLIKDGAIIVNTSRGEAIDENALKNNLSRLGYFATDVLCGEKSTGGVAVESFNRYNNTIIYPHIGGYTHEDLRSTFKILYEYFKSIKGE